MRVVRVCVVWWDFLRKKRKTIGKLLKTWTPYLARNGHPRAKKRPKTVIFPTHYFCVSPVISRRFRSKVLSQTPNKALFYPRSHAKGPNHALEKGPNQGDTLNAATNRSPLSQSVFACTWLSPLYTKSPFITPGVQMWDTQEYHQHTCVPSHDHKTEHQTQTSAHNHDDDLLWPIPSGGPESRSSTYERRDLCWLLTLTSAEIHHDVNPATRTCICICVCFCILCPPIWSSAFAFWFASYPCLRLYLHLHLDLIELQTVRNELL